VKRFNSNLCCCSMGPHITTDQEEDGLFCLADEADTEIRRLRAMVLRAHAATMEEIRGNDVDYWPICRSLFEGHARQWHRGRGSHPTPSDRAARLLHHFANGIESGRIK
jgi:hypothetical protein